MSELRPSGLWTPAILAYAERPEREDDALDRWGHRALGLVMARGAHLRGWRLGAIVRATHRESRALADLTDDALRARAVTLRRDLRRAVAAGRLDPQSIAPAFALVREVSGRKLGLRHYDVQIRGAYALLRGHIAEMSTGEGKTLCAALAATTMALAGQPVHVITVNDYLAKRDAEAMEPIYAFFGLRVGIVQAGQDEAARRAIYASDIVHACNKELAFDYLRDRMVLRTGPGNLRRKLERLTGAAAPLRMRGLHFAIVDEADSVLIDEARTPLVISGGVEGSEGNDIDLFRRGFEMSGHLVEGRDYRVLHNERRIELTDAGIDRLDDLTETDDTAFGIPVIRDNVVRQALTARFLFHRDEAYIVRDGAVQIVDENTGRVMPDRSWSEGLQQMVELKENVDPTEPRETLSRITYQQFFRRYVRLGGMTGTAQDAAGELWSVYGLTVARIPRHKRDRRSMSADRVFRSEARKWRAVAERTAALHGRGCAVLIGTRSVAASEKAAAELVRFNLPHQVLSANQDADEAAIVARAGQPGAITVATNMAGRGTDIVLGAGVAETGGLHVILTERHDSRRVDRQLEGRCGRQGDPGSVHAYLSLEDELMRGKAAWLHRGVAQVALLLGPRAAGVLFRLRQRQLERLHAGMRRDLMESDRKLGDLLAVSGQLE